MQPALSGGGFSGGWRSEAALKAPSEAPTVAVKPEKTTDLNKWSYFTLANSTLSATIILALNLAPPYNRRDSVFVIDTYFVAMSGTNGLQPARTKEVALRPPRRLVRRQQQPAE
ncbi:hypothetical protein [Raoultella terrigena]|uniref:hypothetical protein n=1 Tax=Raoultella terrigena TaxID=577 RepID=UPI0010083AB3|nr:hypothetical protein [Raoultella terrigena]